MTILYGKHFRVSDWYKLPGNDLALHDLSIEDVRVLTSATPDMIRDYLDHSVTDMDFIEHNYRGSLQRQSGYAYRMQRETDARYERGEELTMPDTGRSWVVSWPYLFRGEHGEKMCYDLFCENSNTHVAEHCSLGEIQESLALSLLPDERVTFLEDEKTYTYEQFHQFLCEREKLRRTLVQ